LREDVYQQAINLLQLVKSTCGRSPIASAMFMEELAAAIHDGAIHSKVEVRYYTVLHMHTLSRTTWSKVCVTAGCPSTCLSVPSVNRSSNVQWVCCWVPRGQEIAIFSRRRHSVTPTPQAWLAWCSAVNADIVVLTAALEGSTQTCLHLFFLQFSDVCGKLFFVHFDAELCKKEMQFVCLLLGVGLRKCDE